MRPKHTKDTGCPDSLSSRCVIWNGPVIPCLDICNGDSLTDAMWAVADKVCTISDDIDLSDLDLHCLLDLCESCPGEKTIKTIIQLLLDNQCSLKTLIDGISGGESSCCDLSLNMRCLRIFGEFDNEIPQNLNQTLQSIINELCDHKTRIEALEAKVIDLQDQIDDLDLGDPYVEPSVSICQSGTPKTLSLAIPIVAQDICDYKEIVGSEDDIQSAISKQCPGLNSSLNSIEGWLSSPTNLANSLNNLWIAYCNALERLTLIENTCCKVDCDSVTIAYEVIDNQDADGVIIHFSSLFGNNIPSILHDCGSTITFTDKNDKVVSGFIAPAQEYTSQEYDLSTLDLSEAITISINAKLCSDTMTCVKCISSEHLVADGGCAACEVTITGSSGSVTIYYNVGASQDFITANAGDTVYIPANAINIFYVTNSGDAVPDSLCLSLVESNRVCYMIQWEIPDGDEAPLNDASFTRLYLGANEWALSDPDAGGSYDGSAGVLFGLINGISSPLITASCFLDSDLNRYVLVSAIGDDIPKVRITNPTGEGTKYLYLYGEETDCECPEGFGTGT